MQRLVGFLVNTFAFEVVVVDIIDRVDCATRAVDIGIKLLCVGNDTSDRFSCRSSGIPGMGAQIGQNTPEQIEQFIGMLFLDVCQLLGRGIANELSAAFLEKPGPY